MMILRAIAGGAVGAFAWLLLPAIFMGADWHIVPWVFIGYIFFGLWIGAGIGGVTGFAIWLVNRFGETTLRILPRIAIGVGIAFIALAAYFFRDGSFRDLTVRHFWYSLIFSFAIGFPSGLMAWRTAVTAHSYAAEQIVGRERRERVSQLDSSGDA